MSEKEEKKKKRKKKDKKKHKKKDKKHKKHKKHRREVCTGMKLVEMTAMNIYFLKLITLHIYIYMEELHTLRPITVYML